MNNNILSESYLLNQGFEKKEGNKIFYENVLNSSFPSTTVYVFDEAIYLQISGSGHFKELNIENEDQMTDLLKTLQSVL